MAAAGTRALNLYISWDIFVALSSPSSSEQHNLRGPPKNVQVASERPVLCVVEVVLQFFIGILEAVAIGIHDLRPAGYPRFYVVPEIEEGDLLPQPIHEVRPFRTWAYETHVAHENVDQLRKLIQVKSAQDTANRGSPLVVLAPPHGSGIELGILTHGTELVQGESLSIQAHTFLPEQNLPLGIEPDRESNQGKQ